MKLLSVKKLNRRWNRRDTLLLLERLSMYVSSGLALNECLVVAAKGLGPKQSATLSKMKEEIEAGGLISRSLFQYIGISQTLQSLIEQGEVSGGLNVSLRAAHDLLEREDELVKKCLSALMYPTIIGLFASLLTIGLVRGVMPQIIPMLYSLHVALPLMTRVTMAVSNATVSYGLYALFGVVLLGAIFAFLYKKTKSVRRLSHTLTLLTPLIGKITFSYKLSLFLRSLGTLVSSDVSLTKAYFESVKAISFFPLHRILLPGSTLLEQGVSLGTAISHNKIPSYVNSLILAGESSGSLGSSLIRAATIIDHDIELNLKRLTSLVEPVMMVGMGSVVGVISISIMMPIYDISKVLQHVH